jgi:hypothetical protein
MGSNYEYLPVSAIEARKAWRDFSTKNMKPSGTPDLASVAFIPATGGSFVVLMAAEKHGLLGALKGLGSPHPELVLESFKRYVLGA